MKAWAKSFYLSAAWGKTRAAYLMSQDYICERCGQPAKIVHHKRWLNRENINDISVTLCWDNLEALCQDCHNKEHHKQERLEYLQATDGVPYDIFVKKGLITLSGENYVDYHDVYDWFTMLLEDYGIRPLKIGYDRYSAQYLITDMANYGFHMDDVYQGENLTPVIREFEGIIKDGDFKIADNNLLKTHCNTVIACYDKYEFYRERKSLR